MYSVDDLYKLYCDGKLEELRSILEDEDLLEDIRDELFMNEGLGFIAFIYSI